jgi:hypothetical protein
MAFTETELNHLMDVMGEIAPIGLIEWAAMVDPNSSGLTKHNKDVT